MTFVQYVYLWLLTAPLVALFDLVWLGVLAKDFYQLRLGHLLGEVRWAPAVFFYFIYAAGIVLFAVSPALTTSSFGKALSLGALVGLLSYATYDLTNHATVRDWPAIVTFVDIAWGIFLTGSVASLSYFIARSLF